MSKPEDPEGSVPSAASLARDETPLDPAPMDAADLGGVASLDKVRDILFGVQVREFERRFARLEERLAKDTAELKEEVARRLDAMAQLTASLNEQLSAQQRDFRQHQVDLHQRVGEDIRKQVDHVLLGLARELQELRTEKADRAALASLLNDMSRRLTADAKTPAGEDPGSG